MGVLEMAISWIKILVSFMNCLFVCSNGCLVTHQSSKSSDHPGQSSTEHQEINDESVEDYILMSGFHCGGDPIYQWNDGSSSNYGTIKDIPGCRQECTKREECGG